MIKPRNILVALAAGTFVLAACSAESTDYKAAAEKAITGDSGLGKGSKATCDKPASTDVGTTFECVGTTPDGTEVPLTATIDKKNHVIVGNPTDTATGDSTVTDETVAGDSTETTVGS